MGLRSSIFKKSAFYQPEANDQKRMQAVWRGAKKNLFSSSVANNNVVDTGYQSLNDLLNTNGWPLGVTTEIGLSQPGIGEVRLLLPAFRALQQQPNTPRNIIWIAPPLQPLASRLRQENVCLEDLTIVQPRTVSDAIWASEQALSSASCAAVVGWSGHYQLSNKELRRLQLATEKSRCFFVLFRDNQCLKQSSTSHLRLSLEITRTSELDIHIIKQPNHWGGQRCTLSLPPHYDKWQRLPVNLLTHNNRQYNESIPQQIDLTSSHDQQIASISELPKQPVRKT